MNAGGRGRAGFAVARTLDYFVTEAVRQLQANGWNVARRQSDSDAVWHVAAKKGERWLVVQVLVPATAFTSRREDKLRLSQAAHLAGKVGRMEQWLAHVGPGGSVSFGHDTLSSTAWASAESDQQFRERLGLEEVSS